MGSHAWAEQCSYCGFEEMIVSSYNGLYFEANCPICGYARWTEEKVPNNRDIKIAKKTLDEIGVTEKQKIVELYYDDNIPLITRLKKKFHNKKEAAKMSDNQACSD